MAYELPQNLGASTPEELQALIDGGLDALRALEVTPESDEETLVEGERIVSALNSVRAETARRSNAEARTARAEALIEAGTPTEPEPPDEPPEPDPVPQPDQVESSDSRRGARTR